MKINSIRHFIGVIATWGWLMAMISGCASNMPPPDAPKFSQAPPAPDGMATLYIFRPYFTQIASGVWPVTFFNGVKVADVKLYSYTYVYLRPGTYKITTERSDALSGLGNVPGEISIASNGDYYLAFISGGNTMMLTAGTAPMTIAGPSSHGWSMLSKSQAMRFLPQMRYMPATTQQLPN